MLSLLLSINKRAPADAGALRSRLAGISPYRVLVSGSAVPAHVEAESFRAGPSPSPFADATEPAPVAAATFRPADEPGCAPADCLPRAGRSAVRSASRPGRAAAAVPVRPEPAASRLAPVAPVPAAPEPAASRLAPV